MQKNEIENNLQTMSSRNVQYQLGKNKTDREGKCIYIYEQNIPESEQKKLG